MEEVLRDKGIPFPTVTSPTGNNLGFVFILFFKCDAKTFLLIKYTNQTKK